eukprot:TRINITY_DN54171_c0_g1_i2.p1 TRINITY_DN54171_c0_g1~~TRINITY_DN54171_c0_g1_i2.p1  ORF type:complete len:243 (-),score=34.49 TRINITY_DN54171_c0_g1_i2:286-948(-)
MAVQQNTGNNFPAQPPGTEDTGNGIRLTDDDDDDLAPLRNPLTKRKGVPQPPRNVLAPPLLPQGSEQIPSQHASPPSSTMKRKGAPHNVLAPPQLQGSAKPPAVSPSPSQHTTPPPSSTSPATVRVKMDTAGIQVAVQQNTSTNLRTAQPQPPDTSFLADTLQTNTSEQQCSADAITEVTSSLNRIQVGYNLWLREVHQGKTLIDTISDIHLNPPTPPAG